MPDREINLDTQVRQGTEGCGDFHELLNDAIDLASDQGQRTWLVSGGKRVAAIVTTEDGELLNRWHGLCTCYGQPDWRDDCPVHGHRAVRDADR